MQLLSRLLGIGREVEAIEQVNEYFNISCVVSLDGGINMRALYHVNFLNNFCHIHQQYRPFLLTLQYQYAP